MLNAVFAPRDHLLDEHLQRARRALAAVAPGSTRERLPARLVELLPRLLEAGRRVDLAVLELAALAVADRVERAEDFAREPVASSSDDLDLVLAPASNGALPRSSSSLNCSKSRKLQLAEVGLVAVDGLESASSLARSPCRDRQRRRRLHCDRIIVGRVVRCVKAKLNGDSVKRGRMDQLRGRERRPPPAISRASSPCSRSRCPRRSSCRVTGSRACTSSSSPSR